jgi:hypothetical protein
MHASVSEIPMEEGGRKEKGGGRREVLALHAFRRQKGGGRREG